MAITALIDKTTIEITVCKRLYSKVFRFKNENQAPKLVTFNTTVGKYTDTIIFLSLFVNPQYQAFYLPVHFIFSKKNLKEFVISFHQMFTFQN